MKILCEMYINDFFQLSTGDVAIVGSIIPDIDEFIPSNSVADLFVDGEKITTINIVGEDRFSGGDETKRQGKRSVRTDTNIFEDLKSLSDAKLIIYE